MKRWSISVMGILALMTALLLTDDPALAEKYVLDSNKHWAWSEYTKAEEGAQIEYVGMSSAVTIPRYIYYNGVEIPVVSARLSSSLSVTDENGNELDHSSVAITSVSFSVDALGHTPVLRVIGTNGARPCLITELNIPYGVAQVEAFCGSPQLRRVMLAETVTSLGSDCFADCGLLESVGMESVRSFGYRVFQNNGIKRAELGEGVAVLSGSLFAGCAALESVTIPETVTAIE